MKRFFPILAVLVMAVYSVSAQDVALLEERVKQLIGKVENLEEANAGLKRQVDSLVKELSTLREQQQSHPATPPASNEDLRELARKVQEIEEKRKADRAFLEKEFDRLARLASKPSTVTPPSVRNTERTTDLPKDALEHTVASGDTLLAIALAYSKETGRKITTDMILKANPGLVPERMTTGKKILIPVPEK
jgi:septal ring factor EnvC (AmiA/AmiB activator)/phage tail protein X